MRRGAYYCAAATVGITGIITMLAGILTSTSAVTWAGVAIVSSAPVCVVTGLCTQRRCCRYVEATMDTLPGATMKRNKSDSSLNLTIEGEP